MGKGLQQEGSLVPSWELQATSFHSVLQLDLT